jgi:hypothetical protein
MTNTAIAPAIIISIVFIIVIAGVFMSLLFRIIQRSLNKLSTTLTNLNDKIQNIHTLLKTFKLIEKTQIQKSREDVLEIRNSILIWNKIFLLIGKFIQKFSNRIKYKMISESSEKINQVFNNKFWVRWWSKILLINLWNRIFKDTI